DGPPSLDDFLRTAVWVVGGLALGSLLAGLQGHPRRLLGLVSLAATGLTIGLVFIVCGVSPSPALNVVLGSMGGLIVVPLSATFLADLPVDMRGRGTALFHAAKAVAIALVTGLIFAEVVAPDRSFGVLAGLAGLAAVWAWWTFFREARELAMEVLLSPMYLIRAHGPGIKVFPPTGPLLVVANLSA